MDSSDNELELSPEKRHQMVEEATKRIWDHLENLQDQPAADTENGAELAKQMQEPLPEEPTSFEELLDLLFGDAIPCSVNTAHPGYLAYIPGGGLFHSAVADLISNSVNRYVGAWLTAPALARIEANVIEWFCEIVDYPEEAFGLLTTGGSMANLVATITARRENLSEAFLDGVIYTSDQSHHSVAKAAVLAGFPAENVRSVPTNNEYQIRVDRLEEMIEEDRIGGKRPFLVVGSAGTTNTGAVDNLDALADLCDQEEMWLHADGAYGGFFTLTDKGRQQLSGIERCDSITLDPHKGLFLPYGTGALLVRNGQALARTHATDAEYIPDWDPDSEFVDFSHLSPELSRDFRGLRVWLPVKMHGIKPFRANLEEKLALARVATTEIKDIDHVRVVAEPQLSTLAFRIEPPGIEGTALNELNQELLTAINRRGRVHLSGTTLNDRFTIRISVLSFRTHKEHIIHCIEDLKESTKELLDKR
ncbi:aminotransferase class I/II-fold pyridoxal phosphate-dependent enzyme (plasmid) [Natrinema zhouii]|uniref:pyridoxal phosphate-dependent decarboxylase family protein n=1 Tax=Natrinema zhouii TaxID=1710539 RepID=UPI001CFFB912|nr:aminotransferase class I/II-fold pyridoxal phosphate-dependent enzyme [Natrinema zhouii]UHQ98058.1 aminotransferase class I/II-fold pyridoxal phosphate-dependent enzyme [Natrinema zhouii]